VKFTRAAVGDGNFPWVSLGIIGGEDAESKADVF